MYILIKRDTAENWEKNNPILKEDELALDLTNEFYKVGDGKTRWNDLNEFTEMIIGFKYTGEYLVGLTEDNQYKYIRG